MSEIFRSRNIVPVIALSVLLSGCGKNTAAQETMPIAPDAPAATAKAFPDPAAVPTETGPTDRGEPTQPPEVAGASTVRERVTGKQFKLIGNNACKIVAGEVGGSGEPAGMLPLTITFEAHRDPEAVAGEDALENNDEQTIHEEITAHSYTEDQNEAEDLDSVYKDVLDYGSYWTDRTQAERPQLYVYVPEEPADGTKVIIRQTVTYTTDNPENGLDNSQVTRGCEGMMTFEDKATSWQFVPTSPAEVTAPVCQQAGRDYEGQPADVRRAGCTQ